MKLGAKVQINKGEIETLIKIQDGRGLFKSETYQVVRKLPLLPKEIISE